MVGVVGGCENALICKRKRPKYGVHMLIHKK